jgi:putative DNA methylase
VAPAGVATQLDAVVAGHDKSGILVSTDPPYYDNIGYSDLSDCFYIWLRRTIGSFYPMVCSTVLVPKGPELIASPDRFGGNAIAAKNHFESGFRKVFTSVKAKLDDQFPMTVYYAFKQSDEEEGGDDDDEEGSGAITLTTGWETMLEGLNSSGFQVTGTWPVRASQAWRMRAMGSNALASYIVLACRPRSTSAPLATRKEFIAFLRRELPAALRNLQKGNIAPVDLAQASIGPGMAVFSRYAKVMETDGSPMSVRTALGLINQALDEVLAEQEGEFDAETRFALAWFEQFGMEEGPFGDADVLARAKDTAVNGLVEAGVIKASRGKVQLLKRSELPDDWNPATDKRLTIWEVTQHLIRTVEKKGESAAAALLHQLGGMGEIARDLAYRLYIICERKKWADEALAYNGLVIAWSELSKLALSERTKPGATQTKMFD